MNRSDAISRSDLRGRFFRAHLSRPSPSLFIGHSLMSFKQDKTGLLSFSSNNSGTSVTPALESVVYPVIKHTAIACPRTVITTQPEVFWQMCHHDGSVGYRTAVVGQRVVELHD